VDIERPGVRDIRPGGFDRYEVYADNGKPVSLGRARRVRFFETLWPVRADRAGGYRDAQGRAARLLPLPGPLLLSGRPRSRETRALSSRETGDGDEVRSALPARLPSSVSSSSDSGRLRRKSPRPWPRARHGKHESEREEGVGRKATPRTTAIAGRIRRGGASSGRGA
jgi:hypothetical protein